MKRILTFLAILTILGVATAATSKTDKIQVIYRYSPLTGEWQMYVFGADICTHPGKLKMIEPSDPTKPLEVECYKEEK